MKDSLRQAYRGSHAGQRNARLQIRLARKTCKNRRVACFAKDMTSQSTTEKSETYSCSLVVDNA